MDRLWTPWRYEYITAAPAAARKGVPEGLEGWPGPDSGCVFCNLLQAVTWGSEAGEAASESADVAGLMIGQGRHCFVCLNRFPYSTGHVLVVPKRHIASLVELEPDELAELAGLTQRMEGVLRAVYRPDGINVGLNLGDAAGAGVAGHLHLHMVPRWFGDTNFMTVTAETRVLPEPLTVTWSRIRNSYRDSVSK